MDDHSNNPLLRLFAAACDGRLPPAEHAHLGRLLLEDEDARGQYANFCQMNADLHFQARARRAGEKAVAFASSIGDSVSPRFNTITMIASATMALVASLVLWMGMRGSVQPPVVGGEDSGFKLAAEDRPSVVGASSIAGNSADKNADKNIVSRGYVARVVQISSDVTWGEPTASLDFLLRVSPGDTLSVATGLVQLEFFSGAKIILHGPAVFTPTTTAAGHLESGRLTGEVSEGNFHLMTPAAEVIDLGTAFGVVADAKVGTDVVVFNGKVQVKSRPVNAGAGYVLDMTEGMAARIRSDGTAEYGVESEAGLLVRSVPSANESNRRREISLVDVLGGGDGFGSCLAGAIDPTTGHKDGRGAPGIRRGDGKFHPVDWHPIINGVFVPSTLGGQIQVDSLGGAVSLPPTNGLTWGPLWARRWDTSLKKADTISDFWSNGTLDGVLSRLKRSRVGVVGMHANMGVTIDLRAVQLLQRSAATEFRAIVTNLDNSIERGEPADSPPERAADFSVFVDGELRFSRGGLRRVDGDVDAVANLRPGDRFLTIVSSDSTGDSSFDHLVLIDPVILLERK